MSREQIVRIFKSDNSEGGILEEARGKERVMGRGILDGGVLYSNGRGKR
jgi:hypothetical protein